MTALFHKRILVTRPRAQAGELCQRLAALGAQPICFPTIEIAPLEDYTALDQAQAALAEYDWLVFTSVNSVAAFWSRTDPLSLRTASWPGLNIAAVGPATARAVAAHGLVVTTLPQKFSASDMPGALGDVRGQRILFPGSDLAYGTLAVELRQRGACVDEVVAYRTLPAQPSPHGLAELRRGVDAIIFTSPSSVNNFVRLISGGIPALPYVDPARMRRLGADGIPLPSLGRTAVACLGPTTARASQASGLPVDVTAAEATLSSLIAALQHYFAHPPVSLQENRWTRSLARCR